MFAFTEITKNDKIIQNNYKLNVREEGQNSEC